MLVYGVPPIMPRLGDALPLPSRCWGGRRVAKPERCEQATRCAQACVRVPSSSRTRTLCPRTRSAPRWGLRSSRPPAGLPTRRAASSRTGCRDDRARTAASAREARAEVQRDGKTRSVVEARMVSFEREMLPRYVCHISHLSPLLSSSSRAPSLASRRGSSGCPSRRRRAEPRPCSSSPRTPH